MEQLSQSMFCKNIAHLASIQGSQVSIATAKLAIFLQSIRWESCLKSNFEQLSLDVQNQQCRGGKTPAIQQ